MGLTMFLGIRDAKQGAKPWGAEGALVVGATQLSCAKTDKANQIANSQGSKVCECFVKRAVSTTSGQTLLFF